MKPDFERRHYEAIAQVLQDSNAAANVIAAMATMLCRDNQRCDPGRFINACMPGANVRAKPKKVKPDKPKRAKKAKPETPNTDYLNTVAN